MHPAVGQLLERIVPEGGTTINGIVLPAGVIVGMNPWVAARDKNVYGHDADMFRPERWIEADESTLKLMDRNWLAVSLPPILKSCGSDRQLKEDILPDPTRRNPTNKILLTVRGRGEDLPWQKYLFDGDVKAGAAVASSLPYRAC